MKSLTPSMSPTTTPFMTRENISVDAKTTSKSPSEPCPCVSTLDLLFFKLTEKSRIYYEFTADSVIEPRGCNNIVIERTWDRNFEPCVYAYPIKNRDMMWDEWRIAREGGESKYGEHGQQRIGVNICLLRPAGVDVEDDTRYTDSTETRRTRDRPGRDTYRTPQPEKIQVENTISSISGRSRAKEKKYRRRESRERRHLTPGPEAWEEERSYQDYGKTENIGGQSHAVGSTPPQTRAERRMQNYIADMVEIRTRHRYPGGS